MTDIIQAKETAPLGYHYTNAGILPNEWTSRPLSSIVEEIAETAGTRKIETVSIFFTRTIANIFMLSCPIICPTGKSENLFWIKMSYTACSFIH